VFVLPSHQENFGIAVAEALAVGLPALISNKVNIWREVLSDRAGLVAEDTVQGMSQLFRSYLALPKNEQAGMRQRSRDCFEKRFEVKKAAETLHLVLANAAGAN
jgi:glycosyltransferase involved in cell wall biosynthesis